MEDQATIMNAESILESRGVTRRSFMKLCAGVAAAAGLSQLAIPRIAEAIEESVIGATSGDLYPVIWIEATQSRRQRRRPLPQGTISLSMRVRFLRIGAERLCVQQARLASSRSFMLQKVPTLSLQSALVL